MLFRPSELPRAIIGGMGTVILIYMVCNVAYLAVLPAFPTTVTSGTDDGTTDVAAGASLSVQEMVFCCASFS